MCEELSRQLYACNVACSAIHGDKDLCLQVALREPL